MWRAPGHSHTGDAPGGDRRETLPGERDHPSGPLATMPTSTSRRARISMALVWAGTLAALAAIVAMRGSPATSPRSSEAPLLDRSIAAPHERRVDRPVEPMRLAEVANTFRLDSRNRGRSGVVGPSAGILRCSAATGGRIGAQAVVDGRGRWIVGSEDGHLYVFDRNCMLERKLALDGSVDASPYVDARGRIFVGTRRGTFFGFDSSGAPFLERALGGAIEAAPREAMPGVLYVPAGRDLVALLPDGRIAFRFRAEGVIATTPALDDDGTAYFGARDGRLYAIDREGRSRWTFAAEGDIDASPLLDDAGSVVFGSDDGRVYAVDRDGHLRWSTPLGGAIRASPALGLDGTIVAATLGPRPRVAALDGATGTVRWEHTIAPSKSVDVGVASSPVVDGEGYVYFGAHDGYVYSLSPSGALRWIFRARDDVDASPVLAPDGTLVVGAENRRLYALGGGSSRLP